MSLKQKTFMKTLFTLILFSLFIFTTSAQEVTVNEDLSVEKKLKASEIVIDSISPTLRFNVNGVNKFNFEYEDLNDNLKLSNGTGTPLTISGNTTTIQDLKLQDKVTLEGATKAYEIAVTNDTLTLQESGESPVIGIYDDKLFIKNEENSAVNNRRPAFLNPDGSLEFKTRDTLYVSPLDFVGNVDSNRKYARGMPGTTARIYANLKLPHGAKIKEYKVLLLNDNPTFITFNLRKVNNSFDNINEPAQIQGVAALITPGNGSNRRLSGISIPQGIEIDKADSHYIEVYLETTIQWTDEEIHGIYFIYDY